MQAQPNSYVFTSNRHLKLSFCCSSNILPRTTLQTIPQQIGYSQRFPLAKGKEGSKLCGWNLVWAKCCWEGSARKIYETGPQQACNIRWRLHEPFNSFNCDYNFRKCRFWSLPHYGNKFPQERGNNQGVLNKMSREKKKTNVWNIVFCYCSKNSKASTDSHGINTRWHITTQTKHSKFWHS